MGTFYFYLYTFWKEPEHKMVIQRATKRACMEFFQMGENFDYWAWKVLAGRVPEYSILKERNIDVAPEDRPLKGSGVNGQTWKRRIGTDGVTYNQTDGVRLMRGACYYWQDDAYRSKDGRRHGICGKTKEETERCMWCNLEEAQEVG